MQAPAADKPDMEKFRLRRFVEKLIDMDEVEVHDEHVELADLSPLIEKAPPRAALFRKTGPENLELVAAVNGSRTRIAAAFGVERDKVWEEYDRRMKSPQPVVKVDSSDAPVQQIVKQGKDVDLTKLPFHLQHKFDGGAYLTSGIDYTIDPETGLTNVGCRRLCLRNETECTSNVTAPSDLRRIYQKAVARGERLHVSFAVGSHPLDFIAAGLPINTDEVTLVGTLRGEPVPLVKCVTNDNYVPADAELVLEGYFDEGGYRETDGPYGEYMGYYGPMHGDPVYHVTAITHRKDVLHQSLLHGSGRILSNCDSPNLGAVRNEARIWQMLKSIGVSPTAVYVRNQTGGGGHVRIAIRQTAPGQAHAVFSTLFGAFRNVKHIFVMDSDVDIYDDAQFEWAMSTRFQAAKDIMVFEGMQAMGMDPSLQGARLGSKAGFDLLVPWGQKDTVETRVPESVVISGPARFQTVAQALEEAGPLYFSDLMQAVGSRDGRDVTMELNAIRDEGRLARNSDGQYLIGTAPKGTTQLLGDVHTGDF